MPDLQRQKYAFASPQYIYGVTCEICTYKNLQDTDKQRLKAERWEFKVRMSQLQRDLGQGIVRQIKFCPHIERLARMSRKGILGIPEVRVALDDEHGYINPCTQVFTVGDSTTVTVHQPITNPTTLANARHTYRPSGRPGS